MVDKKVIAVCVTENQISCLPQVLADCKKERAGRLIVMLYGEDVVQENRLRQVLTVLSGENSIKIHLIHEGLPINMSLNGYRRIMKDYPGLFLEDKLTLIMPGVKTKVNFHIWGNGYHEIFHQENDCGYLMSDDKGHYRVYDEDIVWLNKMARGRDFYVCGVHWAPSRASYGHLVCLGAGDAVALNLENRKISICRRWSIGG